MKEKTLEDLTKDLRSLVKRFSPNSPCYLKGNAWILLICLNEICLELESKSKEFDSESKIWSFMNIHLKSHIKQMIDLVVPDLKYCSKDELPKFEKSVLFLRLALAELPI